MLGRGCLTPKMNLDLGVDSYCPFEMGGFKKQRHLTLILANF